MKLLTKEIVQELPAFGEGTNEAVVKFFTPWSNWTWYGCEAVVLLETDDHEFIERKLSDVDYAFFDMFNTGEEVRLDGMKILDVLFYGYVEGLFDEWGTFSLKELSELRGPFGLKVERDLYWKKQSVG